jgi:hypothetical protein
MMRERRGNTEMPYIEISGVCPGCWSVEHFGRPSKDAQTLFYYCRNCGTAFSRKNDVLTGVAYKELRNRETQDILGENRRTVEE